MVIGGATAPDYFFFILSRRSLFYLSQKAFFLSLADGADLADLYDRHMVRKVKICVICGICENTISSRAFYLSQEPFFYLSQISQISQIYSMGYGAQSKYLRHLRHLRESYILRDTMFPRETVVSVRALRDFSTELFGSFKNSAYLCA